MSTDDDTTPPLRRAPSIMGDDERARAGQKSRTPPKGVSLAPEIFEENSENYSGEDLRRFREERFTIPERVSKLEGKMDDVKSDVQEIKADVKNAVSVGTGVAARFDTYMSIQQARESQEAQAKAMQQAGRTHTDSLMRVVKETATETTTATLATRVLDQQDQSVKFRRKFVLSTLKILGIIAGSGVGGAIVHHFLGQL